MQKLRKRISKVAKFFSWTFENALSLDLRSLAAARIFTGIVLLLDIIFRLEDVVMFYTDSGVLTRQQILTHYPEEWRWSLHLLGGNQELQLILFGFAAVFAVMLIVGYKTRLATIASWILLVSIHNRNPMVLNAGDVTFRLLLFWAMFLPWGEYFSIDSKILNKEFKRKRFFSVASFAFIAQLALIYWFSLVYKSGDQWVTEFTSLYYALSLDLFTTRLGYVLYRFEGLMKFLTFAVLKVELIAPFLFFIPYFAGAVRTVGAFVIIGMHIGFALFMELGIFPFVHIAFAIGIIGSMFWDELLPWIHKGLNSTGIFSGIKKTKLVDLRSRLSFIVTAWQAWLKVQRRRSKLQFTKTPEFANIVLRLVLDLFAGTIITFIVLWNLSDLPGSSTYIPSGSRWIADVLRIDQKWNMFSPYPLLNDGWYLIRVTKNDKSVVDFYRGEKPISFKKPKLVSGEQFPNQRWRKYMMNLYDASNRHHRPYFLQYECNLWRDTHPEESNNLMELIFVEEVSLPDYGKGESTELVLQTLFC